MFSFLINITFILVFLKIQAQNLAFKTTIAHMKSMLSLWMIAHMSISWLMLAEFVTYMCWLNIHKTNID